MGGVLNTRILGSIYQYPVKLGVFLISHERTFYVTGSVSEDLVESLPVAHLLKSIFGSWI